MLTKKKVIISIAVLVVLITGVMLLRNQEEAAPAEIKKVNSQVYVKVQQVNFIEKVAGIEFKASLEASEEGIVSSKVGGKVVQILFEEGKYIHQAAL